MRGERAKRIRFALETLIYGVPDPTPCPWEPHDRPPRDSMPGRLPDVNPLSDEKGAAAARKAALVVLHEDTWGFLLLSVHHEAGAPDKAEELLIQMDSELDETWWPAMATTLERVADAVPR